MLHCIFRTNWHCPIVKTSGMEKTVISTEQWLYLLYVIIHTSPFPFQKWPNAYFIFVQLQDEFFYFAGRIICMQVHDIFDMTATCALWNGVNYNAYLYAPPSFITTTLSNTFLELQLLKVGDCMEIQHHCFLEHSLGYYASTLCR